MDENAAKRRSEYIDSSKSREKSREGYRMLILRYRIAICIENADDEMQKKIGMPAMMMNGNEMMDPQNRTESTDIARRGKEKKKRVENSAAGLVGGLSANVVDLV